MNIETVKSKIQNEIKKLDKGMTRNNRYGFRAVHVMESKIQAYKKVLEWIGEK